MGVGMGGYMGVGVVLRLQIAIIDDNDGLSRIWSLRLRRLLHCVAACRCWPLGELPRQQAALDVVGCDVLAGDQCHADVCFPQHPHQQWPWVGSPGAIATQSPGITDGVAAQCLVNAGQDSADTLLVLIQSSLQDSLIRTLCNVVHHKAQSPLLLPVATPTSFSPTQQSESGSDKKPNNIEAHQQQDDPRAAGQGHSQDAAVPTVS